MLDMMQSLLVAAQPDDRRHLPCQSPVPHFGARKRAVRGKANEYRVD